ncbi:MAG: hypothetical protein M1818_001990 [Claussenomyces sp. TS43310]|nr:MAG: hypothetical protein M1818_001990 [Claussenomyces sp. TS43310]
MSPLSRYRRDLSGNTLPAISEDDSDSRSSVPSRSPPGGKQAGPLRFSPAHTPPGMAVAFSDTSSTLNGDEKGLGLRNNEHIAKRGGWKRLALIALIVILCLVALIVGLVVGLTNRTKHNSSNTPWSSSSNSKLNSTYPAGQYTIQTYLSSISPNCTTNSATWRCYPYTTYASSPIDSLTTLDLMIYAFTSTSQTSPIYTISTTPNPFSIFFSNATMVLHDSGLATERYSFNATMNKPVNPTVSLDPSNVSATCYFNNTLFEGNLYTKMNKTYPTGNSSTAFSPWPSAVSFQQLAASGSSTPDCIDVNGVTVGNFTIQTGGDTCTCDYMNYGT